MHDLARRVVLAKAMDGSHCWLSPPPPGDNAPLHHRRCCSAKTRRWRRGLTTANSARCKLPAPMCDRACRTATDTLAEPVLSLRKVPSVQHVFFRFSSCFLPPPPLGPPGPGNAHVQGCGGSQCSCRRKSVQLPPRIASTPCSFSHRARRQRRTRVGLCRTDRTEHRIQPLPHLFPYPVLRVPPKLRH